MCTHSIYELHKKLRIFNILNFLCVVYILYVWQFQQRIWALLLYHRMSFSSHKKAQLSNPETEDSDYTEVHVLYDHIPSTLEPPSSSTRTKWIFLTAIATSLEKAKAAYMQGL